MVRLSRAQAEAFYEVHRGRPFYESLCSFMTSGPCIPIVLERNDAVAHLRKVIGATDPAQADAGTVRKLFAESKETERDPCVGFGGQCAPGDRVLLCGVGAEGDLGLMAVRR